MNVIVRLEYELAYYDSAVHRFNHYTTRTPLTLCRWPAKQTIPLSFLARNKTKGFGLEISPWPEVEGDARRELVGKEAREGSWRGTTDRGSRHRTPGQRDQSEGYRVQTSEGRLSWHSSSFVEVSLESTLALVCTCIMLHNSPSALELTPSVCSFALFPPTPSIVFL